jgi:hypothetical protein
MKTEYEIFLEKMEEIDLKMAAKVILDDMKYKDENILAMTNLKTKLSKEMKEVLAKFVWDYC